MRKYLEQEILADSLKGRIRFNCTSYVNMDGVKIFEIFVDGKLENSFPGKLLIHISEVLRSFPTEKEKFLVTLYMGIGQVSVILFSTPQ